ncbi:MAG: hypothetical protein JWQ98_2597 [Chlorobi bacterium]|nr:hypothetical protein [Chlorobiota bacterium]
MNLESLSTDECLARLDESRRELLTIAAGLPDAQFGLRPDAESWSPGMVLEHVAMVEGSVARVLRALRLATLAGKPVPPRNRDGRWHPDGRRIAPDGVTPGGNAHREEIMQSLADTRQSLLGQAAESSAMLENSMVMAHPFFGDLNGLGWLRMAAAHELNHIDQLRRIMATA